MKTKLLTLALVALTIGLLGSCKKDEGPESPRLPEGALSGVFTVNAEGKKVHFSKGNLVATIDASGAPTAWKFAANQYDCLGEGGANKTIGATAGDIDLFGWSTASTTYGISKSTSGGDYSGEFIDWGKTVDDKNTWATLSKDEWTYLINNDGDENTRKGKYKFEVTVCEKANCLILVPDECLNGYSFDNTKTSYSVGEWATAEAAGLVCLPASGVRYGSDVFYAGVQGYSWSSSASSSDYAYRLDFGGGDIIPDVGGYRSEGYSVRLITEVK